MIGGRTIDALILGGGPAGSTAGALLAEAGIDTVILEGEPFPRFHVGESLLPHSVPLLDRLGVHEKVRDLPHTRFKEGATFVTHDGSHHVVYWFDEGMAPALPHAYQVRRDEFDTCLLDHARARGATVLERWRAEAPIWDGDRLVGLHVRDPDGAPHELRCRVFLDASGQSSFLARKMKWRKTHEGHRKVAAVTHYRGAWLPPGREAGNITIALTAGGWFWQIPFRDDTVSMGAVLDVDHWRAISGDASPTPETLFNAAVAQTPEIARRLEGAERILPFAAIQNFSYEVERIVGDGFCLVGDAAGFLDPVFSTGVFVATTTAAAAADQAIAALRARGRVTEADLAPAAQLTRSLQQIFFSFIQSYYDPHFLALFFHPTEENQIPAAVTSLLAADVLGPLTHERTSRFRQLQKLADVQKRRLAKGQPPLAPQLPATPAG